MDWMTPLGYIIGFTTVGYVLAKGHSIGLIFNLNAIILVYGGTLGATLLSYHQGIIRQAIRAWMVFLFPGDRPEPAAIIQIIIRLAEKARRQGMDSLETDINQLR